MAYRTRVENVRDHIALFGPMTTRQVMNVFGWKLSTASSVMSHGKAYGFFREVGVIPLENPQRGGKAQSIWGIAERRLHLAYMQGHDYA